MFLNTLKRRSQKFQNQTFEDYELIIVNGDRLMIDFIELTESGVQFRLESEEDILTIPIHRVRSLTSRMGDVIYPEAIEYRKSQ